jgi:hypothetical protein
MFLVQDVVQDAAEQQPDRLIPVQVLAYRGIGEDSRGIAQVALDGEGHLVVGEQGLGVGQHHRVVVEVDHPGGRVDPVGDLVHVLRDRQARTDVEQLPDARLADQEADHPAEQVALGAHAHLDRGQLGDDPLGDGPVGGEIVLAARLLP